MRAGFSLEERHPGAGERHAGETGMALLAWTAVLNGECTPARATLHTRVGHAGVHTALHTHVSRAGVRTTLHTRVGHAGVCVCEHTRVGRAGVRICEHTVCVRSVLS